jgi:HEAT repeat protein
MSDEESIQHLLTVLRDSVNDAADQEAVERNLLRFGKAATPALTQALKVEPRNPAWRIAWLLGELRDPDAVPALTEALDGHPEDDVRAEAAAALGKIGATGALGALMRAGGKDERSEYVRIRAVVALGRIGSDVAAPVLLEALAEEGQLRHEAIEALGRVGAIDAVPEFVRALRDPDNLCRAKAAQALAAVGARDALDDLKGALGDEEDEWARGEMLNALKAMETATAKGRWWEFWK